MNNPTTSY